MFETTEPKQRHLLPPSKWQEKAGFVAHKEEKRKPSEGHVQTSLDRALADNINVGEASHEANQRIDDVANSMEDIHLAGTQPDPEPVPRTSMRERRLPAHLSDYHVSFETIITNEPLAPEPILL